MQKENIQMSCLSLELTKLYMPPTKYISNALSWIKKGGIKN